MRRTTPKRSRPFTPLEMMPRLRGRSHFGAPKARCSLRARGPLGRRLQRGLDFRIIPARFNALLGFESQRLEFLTGFTSR